MAAKKLVNIYSSPKEINRKADQVLIDSLMGQFPVQNDHYILTLEDVKAHVKDFTKGDEKEAILKSKSLTYPIKGTVSLYSKATGKLVDQIKDHPLMDAFAITDKHTLMYKGNNYAVSNQLQLLPGVYTRLRENTGELESHFNTGKGASFRITLDPRDQMFYLEVGNTHTPIGPLLTKVFHISEAEAEKYVPKEVWEANIKGSAGKEDKFIKTLYNRMVYSKDSNLSTDEMAAQLREALEKSELNEETTEITLGKSFKGVTKECLLHTLHNLVEVHRGNRQEDNRDSLQFKRVQNLPDFLRTRFVKGEESVSRVNSRMKFALGRLDQNNPKISTVLPAKGFNKVYSTYIQKSSLITTPSETNPIESLENVGKVTPLGKGEGGIGEERGVPMSARSIDPSHLGIIDPTRTPESGHAGIDLRFSIAARRDDEGRMYAKVLDNDGKVCYLSAREMMSSVIGFPDQKDKKASDMVQAQVKGEFKTVPKKNVQYWLSDATTMYTVTTNLVPFLNSNHPGRLTMAGKAIPQALSLVQREAPLVQTAASNNQPLVKLLGNLISTAAPEAGVVTKVTEDTVEMKGESGEIHKIKAVKNLPFNMKGFHDDEHPLVHVGDKVKQFQPLFENNYTKDGTLALGKNLTVSYMPYKGYNHEDGIVISHSAASSLSSHHSYKVDYEVTAETVASKSMLKRYFPGKFTRSQLEKLDEHGYAKVGSTIEYGDPVYAVLEKREPTPEDRLLGRLHKTLVNPYRLVMEEWNHGEQGKVVDSYTQGKDVRILLRSVKELEVGDKLTGLHGNKGVVSLVVPDEEMPVSRETGKAVDIILNPASVTSRVNLGQVLETAAGKIAKKTGVPYVVKNFSGQDNIRTLQQELKDHNISDTEELIDPKTGHSFGKVLTGPQYILKLYKTTDSNLSARNVGGYDNVMQPTKGGEEGSKAVGWMEMLGLLGSNTRANLREISTIKSEQNDDYWAKFIRGEPLPKPKMTFATRKFFDNLRAAGIDVNTKNDMVSAQPLTDKGILAQSHGEILEPKMLDSKNLDPEDGGLFDYLKTGGLKGERWTHYRLAEPVVNPVFESPVRSILGLTGSEFDSITSGKLGVKKVDDKTFKIVDTSTGKEHKEIKL